MLMKIVDNVEIQCTSSEEAAIKAQWAADAKFQTAQQTQAALQAKYPNIYQAIDTIYQKLGMSPSSSSISSGDIQ